MKFMFRKGYGSKSLEVPQVGLSPFLKEHSWLYRYYKDLCGGIDTAGRRYCIQDGRRAPCPPNANPPPCPGSEGAQQQGQQEQQAAAQQQTGAERPPLKLADKARVGVPAMNVPPPPNDIPRLPNLSPEQRAVQEKVIARYLANPDKMAAKYKKKLEAGVVGVAPNVYGTDDVKALMKEWAPGGEKAGEELSEESKTAMAKYNTAVHQTANAISKRAFLTKLDELSKLPSGPKKTVLVTCAGCAGGKGSSLARAEDPNSPYYGKIPAASMVGAVWDSAGEQNATENEWIYQECKKRGITPTFAYIWADPKDTWDARDRGVVRRAMRKGRMVDARLFADSYAVGAKNMAAFVEKHPDANFIFLDNRKKGDPKVLHTFPKETLEWDAEKIYADAVANLKSHKKDLSPALYEGGLAGSKIWGPPKVKGGEDGGQQAATKQPTTTQAATA